MFVLHETLSTDELVMNLGAGGRDARIRAYLDENGSEIEKPLDTTVSTTSSKLPRDVLTRT